MTAEMAEKAKAEMEAQAKRFIIVYHFYKMVLKQILTVLD